jgi:internalin A
MSEMALGLIRRAKAERWKRLDLGRTGIVGAVPEEVGELEDLEELNLSDKWYSRWANNLTWNVSRNDGPSNAISKLPRKLPPSIRVLVASFTQISNLSVVGELKELKRLFLTAVPVKDITPLYKIEGLADLYLYGTHVENLDGISQLKALRSLDISQTHVSDITPIASLQNLAWLHFSQTNVDCIDSLATLLKLGTLNLSETRVKDLKPIRSLIKNGLPVISDRFGNSGSGIFIARCQIENPPMEVAKQGREAILKYWDEQESQGTTLNHEAKVLILGEGGVGKTTLLKRMFNPDFQLDQIQKSTKGIDIHYHHYNIGKAQDMRLNVWDFGGQEIYHATHQFFLTKRSVYILVDDTVKDAKGVDDEQFRYWLEMIELLGGDSPVLIFQNEKSGRSKGLERDGIRKRFQHVREFYAGDLQLPNSANKIRTALELAARTLPDIEEPWPKQWLAVRRALEAMAKARHLISLEEYYAVYAQHLELNKDSALTLSRYLHDLGVLLHFQEDELLGRILILQNTWATEAVFRVLDDEAIKAKHGYFTQRECNAIWQDKQYQDRQIELRQLMMKFELCYELRDVKSPTWLAPQLLQDTRPALGIQPQKGDLILRYEYEVLPKGMVNRLMVRKNKYVVDPQQSWRNGVVFAAPHATVLVEIPYGKREIHFRAQGKESRQLLTILSDDLETLNATFEGLKGKVRKMIPCICAACAQRDVPHAYDYEDLLARKRAAKPTIECRYAPFDAVSVTELLDGFERIGRHHILHHETDFQHDMKTKLFISYSSDDERHRISWDKHSAVLKHLEYIAPWHMRMTQPGMKWEVEVLRELEEADVIVLFVSASFFASNYIWEIELKRARERFEAGECEVAIVIVEPCIWEITWLGKVQVFNQRQPISTAGNEATAWASVVKGVMEMAERVRVRKEGGV